MLLFTVAPKQVEFIVHPGSSQGSTTGMQLLSYFQNDEEPDLHLSVLDELGSPYDLTDVDDVHLLLRKMAGPLPLLVDAAMAVAADPTTGKASYRWPDNLLAAPGKYIGEVSLRYGKPVQATGSLTVVGTVTTAGLLQVVVNAVTVNVVAGLGMSAQQVAAAIVTAVNDHPTVPVTAAVDPTDPTKVNLTAKPVGTLGNAVTYRIEPGTLAAGLVAIPSSPTAMTGGASPQIRTRTLGQFQIDVTKSIATA